MVRSDFKDVFETAVGAVSLPMKRLRHCLLNIRRLNCPFVFYNLVASFRNLACFTHESVLTLHRDQQAREGP
jgi:hypothetical protein